MSGINELNKLGFHDAEISLIYFDFKKKIVQIFLNVGYDEIEKSSDGYDIAYREGKLTFEDVQSCNIDGVYDFKNMLVILDGEINELGCNLYLSSDQSVIINSKNVEFTWV